MARKRADVVESVVGAAERGMPPQDLGFDVWAVLADPAVAAEEIVQGAHDARLQVIHHVARSHALAGVAAAAAARIAALEG